MDSIEKEFFKEIALFLLGFVPGADSFKQTSSELLDRGLNLISGPEKDDVERVASEIYSRLQKAARIISPNDPGRATWAAENFLETVRKARINPDVILDCCLDPEELYNYLLRFPATGIESASGGRQKIYYDQLHVFAAVAIDAVFPTRSFQVRLFHRILSAQRRTVEQAKN